MVAPLVCAFVSCVVGPPVGSLAISVPLLVEDGVSSPADLLLPLGIAALSYLFGVVPAGVAGMACGVAVRARAVSFLAFATAVGAASAYAFARAIDFGGASAGGAHPAPSIEFMALPGALGGLAAGLCILPIARWLGLRGR